jgi:hypothetical protein
MECILSRGGFAGGDLRSAGDATRKESFRGHVERRTYIVLIKRPRKSTKQEDNLRPKTACFCTSRGEGTCNWPCYAILRMHSPCPFERPKSPGRRLRRVADDAVTWKVGGGGRDETHKTASATLPANSTPLATETNSNVVRMIAAFPAIGLQEVLLCDIGEVHVLDLGGCGS